MAVHNEKFCNLCHLSCCEYTGKDIIDSFEELQKYSHDLMYKVPMLYWEKMINFCRENGLHMNMCEYCIKDKSKKNMIFAIYNTTPRLYVISCYYNRIRNSHIHPSMDELNLNTYISLDSFQWSKVFEFLLKNVTNCKSISSNEKYFFTY